MNQYGEIFAVLGVFVWFIEFETSCVWTKQTYCSIYSLKKEKKINLPTFCCPDSLGLPGIGCWHTQSRGWKRVLLIWALADLSLQSSSLFIVLIRLTALFEKALWDTTNLKCTFCNVVFPLWLIAVGRWILLTLKFLPTHWDSLTITIIQNLWKEDMINLKDLRCTVKVSLINVIKI